MSNPMPMDEVLNDLLVKRACEGLSADEEAQLNRLKAASPAHAAAIERELSRFEQAAAAVMLASPALDEPMPEELKAALIRDAQNFVAAAPVTPRAAPAQPLRPPALTPAKRSAALDGRRHVHTYGWWAAAASFVLALFLWSKSAQTPVQPSPAVQRNSLLAQGGGLKLDWKPTQEPAAAHVRGDLVWDEKTQTGYMRFVGLAQNDAARQQYQLWIFDADRDERYPVNGGVFDIPAGQNEIVIPIRPNLPVGKPKLFAVTLEKAGGVVVSSREHIVVTAQPG